MCNFSKANCYGYALGFDFNLPPGIRRNIEVDWTNGPWYEITAPHQKELMDACKSDGLVDETAGGTLIAVFINLYQEGIDYHFYRQDDGTWSHKLGNTGVVVKGISDPKIANRELVGSKDANGDTIIGQVFCGFLRKPPYLNLELLVGQQ